MADFMSHDAEYIEYLIQLSSSLPDRANDCTWVDIDLQVMTSRHLNFALHPPLRSATPSTRQ